MEKVWEIREWPRAPIVRDRLLHDRAEMRAQQLNRKKSRSLRDIARFYTTTEALVLVHMRDSYGPH